MVAIPAEILHKEMIMKTSTVRGAQCFHNNF